MKHSVNKVQKMEQFTLLMCKHAGWNVSVNMWIHIHFLIFLTTEEEELLQTAAV